ncbi:MAG TPA: peptidoglycan editing factor PgeF [bacterium]|jgi:YfiH family protein|nr:peptidoglycan editing factor PgeF [bacterium]
MLNKLSDEILEDRRGGVLTLSFPRLGHPTFVKHAISTRMGGVSRGSYQSMNISYKVSDESLRVEENRRLLSESIEMNLDKAVYLTQVHSDKVFKLDSSNLPPKEQSLGEGDALITNLLKVPIGIMVADCLPVLFYDQVHKAIGLAHAGWRGTVAQIAVKTLYSMAEAYGTNPAEVKVVLGPAIGPCCYEVGLDVKEKFDAFHYAGDILEQSGKAHWKMNIPEANARQLLEAGVAEDHLIRSNLCTVDHINLFYSHRADASPEQPTGRFGAFIMLVD